LITGVVSVSGCAVTKGQRAPDWKLTDAQGAERQLSDYRGKVVLLDFWATWCPPCLEVSPHMQTLHERYADQGVVVLGVHYNDEGDPAEYMKRKKYTYPCLLSGRGVARTYGVSQIPTILVIDRDGVVAHRQTGFADGDEKRLAEIIEAALPQNDENPS